MTTPTHQSWERRFKDDFVVECDPGEYYIKEKDPQKIIAFIRTIEKEAYKNGQIQGVIQGRETGFALGEKEAREDLIKKILGEIDEISLIDDPTGAKNDGLDEVINILQSIKKEV